MRDRVNKQWDDFPLDSDEEYLFLCWYEEAESMGLVGNLMRQPEFSLSPRQTREVKAPTKTNPDKTKEKFLLHPHSYKADFSFEVVLHNDKDGNLTPIINSLGSKRPDDLIHQDIQGRNICVVDVKGGFAGHQSRNSSDVTFANNQKWVYDKYKIYVNKVVIAAKKGLFKNFWAPDAAFTTIKGNPSTVYRACCRCADVKKCITNRIWR